MNELDKAIKLHEEHMEKPATATAASQKKLMNLMKQHKKGMPEMKKTKTNHLEVAPYDDGEWRAKDDLRTLQQAEEIRDDPARLKKALAVAGEQKEDLESIIKQHKGVRG